MMVMIALRIMLATLVGFLLFSGQVRAQEPIAAARDLYASARYDEALNMLERLSTGAASHADRQSIDFYRTLCLLAVGRRDDADRAIEAIVARDPLFRPGDDLSPRTRSVFAEAKRRVLPGVVQQYYAEAKRSFERKEYDAAAAAFKQVIDALNDPDIGLAAQQPPLSDLRTVAAGFYDLSVKSIPPPPPPPVAPAPAPAAAPVNLPPRIYTGEEAGLRPPIAIAQELPRYPGPVPPTGFKGVIDVLINENGTVESAVMTVPVTNMYDKLVLNAASRWVFHPATVNGTPVKFRKRISINIAPPLR
jgi:tetratricopeptide (TPR) repeat protein